MINTYVSNYNTLTVLDLQTNETITLPNEVTHKGPVPLFIVNNKMITVNLYCTITILNKEDLILFKEFKNLEDK